MQPTPKTDRPWEVPAGRRVLVFGDVHQRLNWADAALAHEAGQFDHVVFLGDVVHSFETSSAVSGIRETARWYARLIRRPNTTVLLGNHEAAFMESDSYSRVYKRKPNLLHGCSGFRPGHAIEFAKEVTPAHWRKVGLFTVASGWLLSHAGVHSSFWRPLISTDQNLARLWEDSVAALQLIQFRMDPLLACGPARSDIPDAPVGGLTWLDWRSEFQDDLPLPQIVGHTHCFDLHRRKGRSWCVDSGIGYVIIAPDGGLEHKAMRHVKGPTGDWTWQAGVPQLWP